MGTSVTASTCGVSVKSAAIFPTAPNVLNSFRLNLDDNGSISDMVTTRGLQPIPCRKFRTQVI